MIRVLTHNNFDDIKSQWNQVIAQSLNPTIFLTSWWNQTWFKYFNDGSLIEIIEIYENEHLIGIAPLSIKDNTITFIGDEGLYDYRDFIVIVGKEELFFEQLAKHLYSLPWKTIELNSIPTNSPTLDYLPRIFESEKNKVDVYTENSTPTLFLTDNWDTYLSQLPKKNRHELKRKMKRLESQTNYEIHVCQGKEIHPLCLDNFFNLHKLSSEEKLNFWDVKKENFFKSVSQQLISQEMLVLHSLIVNDKSVATAFIIKANQSFLLYNSGFDPSFSQYSVGVLNTAFAIKNAIECGQKEFNFLKGKEKYKYHLGGQDMDVFTITITKP